MHLNKHLTYNEFRFILKFNMQNIHYTQPFSTGQITIPKFMRQHLGINNNTWIKIELHDNDLILTPQEKHSLESEKNKKKYIDSILSLQGGWFSQEEYENLRNKTQKKMKERYEQYSY